jgi:tetratricopeptide (TPR) repeat protein
MDFYGRDAEHAFLLDAFRSCVTSGSPRLVTVVAETGVGKSRLVQHLYNTITKDEQFDPGASNYWPDAFQTPVMQLRVTPDMHTHTPAGPPRFWWLGVRWSNPQERNVLQSSVLPELQKQLTLHAAITKSFATKWQQSLENIVATMREDDIRRDIAIETLTLLLQVNIPLSGLIIDMIRPAIDPWTGADIVYADEHEDAAHEELRTQLLQTFTSMYAKPTRIPIVLWLDDAQWMDPGSREFFRQLYTQAVARKWPLFFVATHWPQEWEEYGKTTFLGRGHRLTLGEPAQSDMAALVHSRLPGLTTMQQELILAKSMGNYLALLENIGQILSSPTNFQESDVTGALSAHGEQVVTAWETNRQRRIKQRFEAFESDVRALLARFSHIGSTFVRSVVRTYATGQGIPYSEALVNRCIAPLTIVSEVSTEFHEFRDRGYFSVAAQYFDDWLHEDEHVGLTNAIRTEAERFVDSGYTAEAEFAADAQTLFAQLSDQEQTLILNLALKTAPNHRQLWIRTVLLRCKILAAQRQWEEAGTVAALLIDYDWDVHQESWVHHHALEEIAAVLVAAGALDAALRLQQQFLHVALADCDADENPTTLKSLSLVYNMLGDTHQDLGDTAAALEYYRADLETTQQLILLQNTPENQRTLSVIYNRIGMCLIDSGENDAATVELDKGWAIIQSLLQAGATDDLRRDVSFTAMELAFAAKGQSDKAKARVYIETAVALRRELCARERTAKSLMELAFAVHKLSYVKRTNKARLQVTEEALLFCREGMQLRGNTADMITLIEILETLGQERCQAGQFDAGLAAFEEMIAVQTKLAEMRGTVMERRQLVNRMRTYVIASMRSDSTVLDRLLPEIRAQLKLIGEQEGDLAASYARLAQILLEIGKTGANTLWKSAELTELQGHVLPYLEEAIDLMRRPDMRVIDMSSFTQMISFETIAILVAEQIEATQHSLEVKRIFASTLLDSPQTADASFFLQIGRATIHEGLNLAVAQKQPAYARIFETLLLRYNARGSS